MNLSFDRGVSNESAMISGDSPMTDGYPRKLPDGTIIRTSPSGKSEPRVCSGQQHPDRRRESYWFCFAAAAAFSALAWNARPSGLPSEAPGVVADATPRLQLMASKTTLSTC